VSDSRWQHMQWLFHEAMRQPEDQRVEWLKAACAEDAALFQEVDTLLRASGASVEVLEPRTPHPDQGNARAGEGLPDRIGPYRIIRRIGQGGMGSVYEAEEDRPRRRVALKVMRGGVISADAKKRFEHEAQMLARLHHPGIAKIFGAGTVQHRGEDIEYIAMDLIDGSPLTVFAHTRKLPHRERLELLARVCDAVQHAHQRGVIHRDLKPSNILVSADGQPTVVDFGIARATDADVRLTRTSPGPGPLLGTVPYMSPEQAAGDVAAIDTRSDVYSLGVIGYELLSGRPSVDPENRPLPELLRAIREDDPAPLSTFDRSLRGDVETIIATALDKTPERRYQSAGALAADIRRHLNDQSILARPVSRAELIVRFTRRHRALVAGAGIAVTALVAATIVTTVLAVQ
jgi:serine/threonine protein kinase